MEEGLFLDQLIQDIIVERRVNLGPKEVSNLCDEVCKVLLEEESLLYLESPIKICGDIHGQLNDLIRVLQTGGFDEDSKYLFLGDYVDRGPNSVEVICLLFALKLRFPNNVFLLRGNHESPEMTESFGFADECEEKLDASVLLHFYDAFDCLPIAALINNQIFCVHGGLSPEMTNVEEIKGIQRPTAIPDCGILADLLWSDPSPDTENWGPNDRGETFTWGLKVAQDFMDWNDLTRIVRGHQMAQNGIDFPFFPDRSVITVFTASNYAGRYDNVAAFVEVDSDPQKIGYQVLRPPQVHAEMRAPNTPRADVKHELSNQAELFLNEDDAYDEDYATASQ
ncbi:Ser/Thr protein phosphatase [Tritrichomonas foetus]|uniref:Serine/threonine-protein phosphatase n=1 Tax=Tritrichomonas foetus TaxID=1144522 RepID=A0A1J4KDX1_9EUKA|nr:Ser/Thr protein phosphatase [Tritrichomonas foetus]|eukprot:OHT09631.1 Ser/Thr protein phosphatase [Tritrichomonas foetus]